MNMNMICNFTAGIQAYVVVCFRAMPSILIMLRCCMLLLDLDESESLGHL